MPALDHDIFEILEPDSIMDEAFEVLEDIVPGADVVVVTPEEDEVSKDDDARKRTWEDDGDHAKFINYVRSRLDKIPRHTGQTTVGCERAIAYLKRLDREISRAIQSDDDNVIDEEEAEKIRDTIMEFVDKLEDAHDKLFSKKKMKKKASVRIGNQVVARINDGTDIKYYIPFDDGEGEELLPVTLAEPTDEQVQIFALGEETGNLLVKEAGSAKIFLFEDPFLHAITRLLINSHVSAGRDIEKVYAGLRTKYDFTPREELSIQELLLQKGLPMFKDLGRIGEDQDPTSPDGVDFGTTYHA